MLSSLFVLLNFCLALDFAAATVFFPPREPILRNLAFPRYFGAAANTTFLHSDVEYTRLATKHVRPCDFMSSETKAKNLQFSMFTPENESTCLSLHTAGAATSSLFLTLSFSEMGEHSARTWCFQLYCRRQNCCICTEGERSGSWTHVHVVSALHSLMGQVERY
jgi:hypothetical protein